MKSSCPNAMGSTNHNIAGIVSYQNNHDFLHPPWTTMIKDLGWLIGLVTSYKYKVKIV